MKKDTKSIVDKYKKESKRDGFNTRTNRDLQKDRDKIKSGYMKMLVFAFVGTLILTAAYKFITGDYTPIQRGTESTGVLLKDSIDLGDREPSIELLKGDIAKVKKDMSGLKSEYEDKLQAQQAEYQKRIAEIEAKARLALEKQSKKNAEMKNKNGDNNNTEEKIAEVRNSFSSQIEQLKKSMKMLISKKDENLPSYKKNNSNAVGSVGDDKTLKNEVLVDGGEGTKTVLGDPDKPKYVFEQYTIGNLGAGADVQAVLDTAEKNTTIEFEITTGLSEGLLITGVQAPTFGEGKENPKPVMVSFTSPVLLANEETANITDCVGVGSAVGNMNTKRAEITVTRLSCIMEQYGQKFKVSAKVKGFLMGRDGAYGVPGRLVDSGSKVVMRQIQVGFLQGVASAFQYSQGTGIYGVGGTNVSTIGQLPDSQTAMYQGASNAASTGLNSLAAYYTSMMDGLYPTVSVMAGVSVDVFWPEDTKIKLEKVKLYDVTDRGNSGESVDQPFQTEADEELVYDSW